jgi:methyl-accepting chemotaxis protein
MNDPGDNPAMLSAFRNLRVSIKIILPLAMMALMALGVGGFISRTMIAVDGDYSDLIDREATAATFSSRLNALTLDLGRSVWVAVAYPEAINIADSIGIIETMEAELAARIGPVRAGVAGTPLAADLAAFEREFPAAQRIALTELRRMQTNQVAEAVYSLREDFYPRIGQLRDVNRRLTEGLLAVADARRDALSAEARSAVISALVVLGLGVALSLAFGVWLTLATVVRPFGRIDRSMQQLAGGDLDTKVNDTERGDEIGGMARALQVFAGGLRDAAVLRLEQEALKLRTEQDRKAGLIALAGNLEQTVGGVVEGIASAAGELNAAATSMVGIAEATSSRAGIVSNASGEASGNVNTVAAATEELAASVAEISRQVADSARMAGAAVEQANRTNATVANLTEAAAKIGEVTRLIGDIAGQTNLLALNATIEAARAGEAGKGFAVVASEVKALANQTAQATGSIATQIQAMQAATREAATDIGVIRDSIGSINEVTAAIAAAVEQQGAATRDIAQNVQRAAVGTAEIATAIDGVTTAASETGGAAGQVQATSATLAEQAATLRREVGEFLGRVRAA